MLCPSCGRDNPDDATFCNGCATKLDTPAEPLSPSTSTDGISISQALTSADFVGRQREMGELVSALDDALAGRGRLVMLVGEPGIGKTRTAQELAAIAEQRDAQVLWGRCYEGEGAPPYWPWLQPLRAYVEKTDAEVLLSRMGAGASDIAEIMPELRAKLPELKPPPALEPESARFRLFDSITTFLKNVAQEQPMVLVLDNLHWADRSSLLLLEFLCKELESSHLLVLGTYRDVELSRGHPLAQSLGELTRDRLFQRIPLRGLTHEDVVRYIETASQGTPQAELVDAIYTRSEGNPLFVGEMARLLVQEEGEWSGRIPEGIREVIGRRLDRLSEDCNRTLTVASVIGREFELGQLSRLVEGLSQGELLEALEEALRSGVIEEVEGTVGRYGFSHALIQQTLASELSTTRRVMLHAQIAEALEELYGTGVEAHASELARHFNEAQTVLGTEKLVHYSILAGEQALATYANEEAQVHFERALAAKEGQAMDADKAALLFGLGRAQSTTLERHRQHEAVTTVIPAFEYYVAAGDVSEALAIAEYPFRSTGARAGTAQLLAEALKLVPSDSHQAGRLLVRYGSALGNELGNFETVIEALGQALAIAQRENDTALEMTVLTHMASAHWIINLDPQESLKYSIRAIELDRGVSQIQFHHNAHWWAAMALIALGDLEMARPHTAARLAMAEKHGDRYGIATALHGNEDLAHLQGNWETARDFSDRGLAVARRDVRLVSGRATLEYELGDFGQGDAYLERLVETMRLSQPGPTLEYSIVPLAIGVAARITGMARQFDIAEAAANIALSSPTAVSLFDQLARTGLALMAIERGDVAVAREQYDILRPRRLTVTPLHLMCGHRVLGLLAHTMGNLDDAAAHFEDALAFCRKAGYRPELAWACYDYADMLLDETVGAHGRAPLPGGRQKAMQLLDEALSISTELGMRPLTEKATALKEKAEAQPAKTPAYPDGLTEREVEVLRLIAAGKSNRQIAEELVISVNTVIRHVGNIFGKTDVANRTEAAVYANQNGLVS